MYADERKSHSEGKRYEKTDTALRFQGFRGSYKSGSQKASSDLYISPRYLANIENKGQHPSLQVFYDLVTRYDISVDEFFFPDKSADKTTQRRQLDAMLDNMSEKGLRVVSATAKEIAEIESAEE